jgi:hypothetical protein
MAAERIIPPVCAVAAERESPRIRRRLMGAAYRRERIEFRCDVECQTPGV